MTDLETPARIDAHVHLWELARGDYAWMSPDLGVIYRDFRLVDLEPLLRAVAVDRAVLVQAAATVAETRYLLGIAEASERIAAVIGWVNFESPAVAAQLDSLLSHVKFKGVRPMIQFLPDSRWMLREVVRASWDAVEARDLAVDFLVAPAHLQPLHELLLERPTLRAVIDHGAKPSIAGGELAGWAANIHRLAQDTKAFCKLSGLATEAGPSWNVAMLQPYVDTLLNEFGPERLMFGSDWPVVTLAANYRRWWDAAHELLRELSDSQRAAVFGKTAMAFYRL